MAVRLEVAEAGYLAYPAAINLKPALNNAGADQGYGWFEAGFVEVPWTPGSTIASFLWGHDADKNGAWAQNGAGGEHALTLSGPNAGTMRNRITTASAKDGGTNAWPAATRTWTGMTPRARSAMGESRIYLIGHGLLNLGDAATPDWHFFRFAWPQSGGSAATDTYIDALQKTNADGYVAAPLVALTHIFNAKNSVAHMAVEWLGVFRGEFPHTGTFAGGDYALDTTVLQDLIDGTKTYKTQAALRVWAGEAATIIDLRPLINGDLTAVGDSTSAGKATALVPTGAHVAAINTDAGIIQPAWAPLSVAPISAGAPAIGFWGGRGQVAPRVSGRKLAGVALEVRVEDYATGAALAGFDWQALATTGATAWSATLPASPPVGGPYRLRVRDAASPATQASTGAPLYVGCIAGHWGQSQVEVGFNAGVPYVASAANRCWALALIDEGGAMNQQALSAPNYTRPSGALISLNAADAPNYAGLVAAANEWTAEHPDEPLLLVNLGLKTFGLNNLWAPECAAWKGEGVALPANMPGAPAGSAWYCWGNNLTLPGLAGGEQSGLMTTYALLLDRYIDAISFDMGTADATLSKPTSPAQYVSWGDGAYQTWETNFASCADYLRTVCFSRSPNVPIIIHPFGRYNTSASEGWKLRDKQALRAMTSPNEVLGAALNDCQMDYGTPGSPHQRNGAGAGPGINNEVTDEGNQRRMRRIMASVNRCFDTSLSAMGPRMVRWWRDAADPAVAWIETGWRAGLKTPLGAPYEAQDLPEFYFSADGTWGTVESSYHPLINAAGTFYARLDPAHPSRIKLTRKSGAAAWPASAGTAAFEYLRSAIFDSGVGTKFQERDGALIQASATINVLTALNLLVYGEAPNDGGRGIMLRQTFGTGLGPDGLVQSTPPAAGAFKLLLTEKVAPGPRTLTLNRKNAAGEIVATKTVEVIVQ